LAAEHAGDDVELLVDVPGVGLGEDGADGGGDHLGVPLRDLSEDVTQEVGLGGRASPGGNDGGDLQEMQLSRT
jgi:hypothetical protein